jgi:hypothetical protein
MPRRELRCTDDDPSCDFGTAGDHACTFHVALCFNVVDSRLPLCAPDQIETLTLIKPKEGAPKTAIETTIRDMFEAKFSTFGACIGGSCAKPPDAIGFLCTANSDCDDVLGDGTGLCKGRFGALLEVIDGTNVCTGFMDLVVPLKLAGNGLYHNSKENLQLLVEPTPDPVTGKLRKGNKDKLKLICNAP